MQVRIKLPTGSLIHYLQFRRAIAEASAPIDLDSLTGINCVVGKKFSPDSGEIPYALDEADRAALSKLLPNLPALRYPISTEEAAAFMKSYQCLKVTERPIWTPILLTEEEFYRRKFKHNQIEDRHLEALRKECQAGRLAAVDSHNVPVRDLQFDACIPRKEAIAYLERFGLAYEDNEARSSDHSKSFPTMQSPDVIQSELIASEVELHTKDNKELVQEKLNPFRSSFTLEEKAEAVALYYKLKEDGHKDYTRQTAQKYGVSEKTINNWVNDFENKKKEANFHNIVVNRNKK